jgi:hypothetical protein
LVLLKLFFANTPPKFDWNNYLITAFYYNDTSLAQYENIITAIIETKSIAAMKYFLPIIRILSRSGAKINNKIEELVETCTIMIATNELQKILRKTKAKFPNIDITRLITGLQDV